MTYRLCSFTTIRHVLMLGVVCGVLALAGCGSAHHPAHASTPTSIAASTSLPLPTPSPQITTLSSSGAPVAGPTPDWKQAALPTGFGMAFHQSDIAVAGSDGNIAYACLQAAKTDKTEIVITHDGGASWGPITQLSGGFADAIVDAEVPTTALLYDGPLPIGTGALTTNGGSTWRAYTVTNAAIYSLATSGSSTYAILASSSGNGATFSLEVSRDGMHTWQPISVPYGIGGTDVLGFWGPVAGSMLAETGTNGTSELWQSSDDGAHWAGVPLPALAASWIEAAPGPQPGSWRIYVEYDYLHVAYSTDEGARWTVLPDLGSEVGPQLAGIGSDGAVLATLTSTDVTLFRFVPGATRWQSLGVLPPSAASITYAPTPGGGIFWAFPAESDGASGAGPANAVYSAPYPAG